MSGPSAARELASTLGLRAVPARREWRGDCPSCGYAAGLILSERDGKPLWWCSISCQDGKAIGAVLKSAGALSDRILERRAPAAACAVERSRVRVSGIAAAHASEANHRTGDSLRPTHGARGGLRRGLAAGKRPARPHRGVLAATVLLLLLVGEGSVVEVLRRL